ncbi:MAG TPA: hypothetical protein VEZ14_07245 [Dehalococcoidia bacterium]|nr:hypothetical protein [Dehalococcoidia bacterium]
MVRVAVVAVTDLMFQPRLRAAAETLGLAVRIPYTAEEAGAEIAAGPEVVIVDLHDPVLDATSVIVAARQAGAKVLAFGRHTEPDMLRQARLAGANVVVARSRLVEDLPRLIDALVGGDSG